MGAWDDWMGRTETREDVLSQGLIDRWRATFDRGGNAPDSALLPGIHWCLCLPDAPTAKLGEDGHAMRSDDTSSLLPPVPLARRMWASSRMVWTDELRADDRVTRTSRLLSITDKIGTTGPLTLVEVEHTTATVRGPAIQETQTLVYRAAANPDDPVQPPPRGAVCFDADAWDAVRTVVPSRAMLFRYSALTFNTHRIHYDQPYAQGAERYRDLIVHGPLTATWLLQIAADTLGRMPATVTIRAQSPAVVDEPLHLAVRRSGETLELGAFADDGRAIMAVTCEAKGVAR